MIDQLRSFFSTPSRQAALWAAVGVLGVGLGVLGVWLYADEGGSGGGSRAAAESSPTPRPSPSPTPSPSPSPTATSTPTETPQATATSTPQRQASSGGGGGGSAPPAPTPTPELVAGGPYCNTISSSAPPNSVIGTLTIGGSAAPAGTVVSLSFDGVAGPSLPTRAAGGYRVDYSAGGSECANRVGAAISVVVNGQAFATGRAVGSGDPVVVFNIEAP